MADTPDLELQPAERTPASPPPPRSPRLWIAIAALVVGALAAFYFAVGRRTAPEATPEPESAAAAPAETRPLGGDRTAVEVPPLDESDAVVRTLVGQLSSHPQVAAWLATDGLVRNFTVVVANVGDGRTPATHLRRLRPTAPFQTVTRGNATFIDPRSYDRYNGVAGAAASIDPAGAANLYATLKPRIEEAYRDLGHPDTPFDAALERAIVALLSTPVPDGDVQVEPLAKGIGYRFADPDLEALSESQKLLLRMGPVNARAVQASLRRIALALGISGDRLPQPSHQ